MQHSFKLSIGLTGSVGARWLPRVRVTAMETGQLVQRAPRRESKWKGVPEHGP